MHTYAAVFAPFYHQQWRHQLNCPYRKSAERVYTIGFSSSLTRLVGKAFSLSVSANVGAGSYSVTPALNVRNVVCRASSPAFQLFDIAARKHQKWLTFESCKEDPDGWEYFDLSNGELYYRIWDVEGSEDFLKGLVRSLDCLFTSGKASATDRDEKGETLLHVRFFDHIDTFVVNNHQS